jgi:FkbM family methyltransferase
LWDLGKKLHLRASRITEKLGISSPKVRCDNGRIIYVEPRDDRGRYLIEKGGNINPNSLAIWQTLLAEQSWTHVIDVGANYGEMLVGVELPLRATTIALEPNPYVLPYLRRTLAEAKIELHLLAVAASDRTDTVKLTIDRNWSGLSSVAGIQPESAGHTIETIDVPATTLAAVVARYAASIRSVSLLVKIDVESYEVTVLRGLGEAFAEFEAFAAMAELIHLSEPDTQWLLANFAVELLDIETGKLTIVDATTPAQLQQLLATSRFYRTDAVLRRRHDTTTALY